MKNKKKVMVFGVFDSFHPGHESFLKQARKHGEQLVVVVARNESVVRLKRRVPVSDLAERMQKIIDSGLADEVVMGDTNEGAWEVLDAHKPDVIALGYDQEGLKKALESVLSQSPESCKMVVLEAYEPHKYKSSLMNKKEAK